MIPSENDDEEQVQDSLGTDTGENRAPRYSSTGYKIVIWLIFQLVFFLVWGFEIFWNFGFTSFSFAWCVWSLMLYLLIDRESSYFETEAKEKKQKSVSLKCPHCGAFYAYRESDIDYTENSVVCQNCGKRFQVDIQ